jgi:hypothetical protein
VLKAKLLGLACMALFDVQPAAALTYTYIVNEGSSAASVTGFIQTNTLGNLGPGDIVDWNLLVTIGNSSADLAGPLTGNTSTSYIAVYNADYSGSDVTATSTGLFFDFGDTNSLPYLQFVSTDNPYNPVVVCFNNSAPHSPCTTLSDPSAIDVSLNNVDFVSLDRQGNAQFASVATTPLPAALPLFATGLGVMGLLGWRRKRKGTAAIAAA